MRPIRKTKEWFKRTEPAADRFKLEDPGAKWMLRGSVVATGIACIPPFRNMLPEPWDVADHSLNLAISMVSASLAGLGFGRFAARFRPEGTSKNLQRVAIGLGIAAVAAGNMIFESKTGSDFFNVHMDGFGGWDDAADAWYGIAGAVVGAVASIRCHDRPDPTPAAQPELPPRTPEA